MKINCFLFFGVDYFVQFALKSFGNRNKLLRAERERESMDYNIPVITLKREREREKTKLIL